MNHNAAQSLEWRAKPGPAAGQWEIMGTRTTDSLKIPDVAHSGGVGVK